MPTARALLDPRVKTTDARLPARVRAAWRRTIDRLLPLGGSSDGNRIELFFDGDAAYQAMLDAIDGASHTVWLETYIFEPDSVGMAFLDALTNAARRGVEVLLLTDSLGSPDLQPHHVAPLVDAGGKHAHFNAWFRSGAVRRPLPLLQRDHRKILIVDGVGFTGGMNISRDYAGPRLGNARFRDSHARVHGPAVADLAAVFSTSWRKATGQTTRALSPPHEQKGGVFAQVLGSDVFRRRRHIQRALYQTVGRAVSTCHLTTPYFVPPPRLLQALVRAARRGVDVVVLTAGLSDVPIVSVAARHLYGTLLRAGVRVFEMTGRTLHAKTASIDGVYASVGSFNLDRWSFSRNLEVNLAALDPQLAGELEAQLARDLEVSREVKLAEWTTRSLVDRLLGWLAYQLMRL